MVVHDESIAEGWTASSEIIPGGEECSPFDIIVSGVDIQNGECFERRSFDINSSGVQ